MPELTVEDYLAAQEGVQQLERDGPHIVTANDKYRVRVTEEELSPGVEKHFKRIDFEKPFSRIEVDVNRAPQYLGNDIDAWVEYELGKRVAQKYGIETYDGEKDQIFFTTAITTEDVDNLLKAVKEYDRLFHLPEIKALKEKLPALIADELAKLL